jgi:TDG/mug DNA glycosylase family protein
VVARAAGPGWSAARLRGLVEGGGYGLGAIRSEADGWVVELERLRTLPDWVAPGLRVLVCGLNPSVFSADAGVGFARPGNRFWPAALAAGLVTRALDPEHAVVVDRVGMTDLVKRATARSAELAREEYRAGFARVERLVSLLRPGCVCFVGLEGWRAAVDRRAVPGWQPYPHGGVPVYVMPSTSGLNARVPVGALAAHLAAALQGPARGVGGRGR